MKNDFSKEELDMALKALENPSSHIQFLCGEKHQWFYYSDSIKKAFIIAKNLIEEELKNGKCESCISANQHCVSPTNCNN